MIIGTTSYIYPVDILNNVKKLLNKVNDVELVLFETPKESNLPSQKEIKILHELSLNNNLTYTVHLPLSISLAHTKKEERLISINFTNEIIKLTTPLNPFSYIIHISITDNPLQKGFFYLDKKELQEWKKRTKESLLNILGSIKSPSLLSIENINYPFEYLNDAIYELNLSVCLDIGHLILYSNKLDKNKTTINIISDHLSSYSNIIRVIHLHGVVNNKDHKSLIPNYKNENQKGFINNNYKTITDTLKIIKKMKFDGVLTLEVFNKYDFMASLSLVNSILK